MLACRLRHKFRFRTREAGSARTTAGRSCEAAADRRSMDGLRVGREEAVTEHKGPAKRALPEQPQAEAAKHYLG